MFLRGLPTTYVIFPHLFLNLDLGLVGSALRGGYCYAPCLSPFGLPDFRQLRLRTPFP